jgi:hypothetical protein
MDTENKPTAVEAPTEEAECIHCGITLERPVGRDVSLCPQCWMLEFFPS